MTVRAKPFPQRILARMFLAWDAWRHPERFSAPPPSPGCAHDRGAR